jgi:(heptosyl)LPS beta-1,4-glucosyltransferase
MYKISVVINTLNEEKNLPRVLASVKNFADELIVVDMHSTDKTVEIAKNAGAKVFLHKRTGYVEPARNYAVSKATGEWILILDADEVLTKSLSFSLKKIAKDPKAEYYRLPRKNIIFGKWIKHSRWWPDYNIRFFKKSYVNWNEMIHSVPLTKGRGLDLDASKDNAIVHYHYDSIEQYLTRMNRYSTKYATLRVKEGYVFKWSDLIKKPSDEFLSRYFFGQGFKDGIHGLALAGLQAFFEFVIYLKIWQEYKFFKKNLVLNNVVKVMRDSEKDMHYWQADSMLTKDGGVINRLKRKFKI